MSVLAKATRLRTGSRIWRLRGMRGLTLYAVPANGMRRHPYWWLCVTVPGEASVLADLSRDDARRMLARAVVHRRRTRRAA